MSPLKDFRYITLVKNFLTLTFNNTINPRRVVGIQMKYVSDLNLSYLKTGKNYK